MEADQSPGSLCTLEERQAIRPSFGRTYRAIASLDTGFYWVAFRARRRDQLVTVRWKIQSDEDSEVGWRSVSSQDPVAIDHLLVDAVNDLSFEAIAVDYGPEVRIAAERIGKAPWLSGFLADYLRGRLHDLSYLGPNEILFRFADGDLPQTPQECDVAWNVYENSFGSRA